MKLRTIINELNCSAWKAAQAELLNADVVLDDKSPLMNQNNTVLVSVCKLEDYQVGEKRPKADEVLLVHTGRKVPDNLDVVENCIAIARSGTFEDIQKLLAKLPAEIAFYDLKRDQIFHSFLTSYDIKQFADKLSHILGNPLVIANADHRLLASAGSFPEEYKDLQVMLAQRYQSEDLTCELEQDGVVGTLRHSKYAVFSSGQRSGKHWANSIIYFHHVEMGRLDVLEGKHPISGFDLDLIDYAGELAGVMLDRLGAAGERSGAGSSVLADLLSGSFVNEASIQARLAMTHLPQQESYVMMLIEGPQGSDARYYRRIATLLGRAIPKSLWTTRKEGVAMMLPIGRSESVGYDDYQRAELRLGANVAFKQIAESHELRAYVSEPFVDITLAQDRYNECVELLEATKNTVDDMLMYFWQHRFVTVASIAQHSNHIDMLLDKRVVAMAAYDHKHGTEYLATAIMSVRYPGSPAEAAQALNVHRNTYFYRMNKVREMFFIDLKDGDDRLALSFSAALLEGIEAIANVRIESAMRGRTEI